MEGITVYSDQRVWHYEPEKIRQNQKIMIFYQSATQTMISVLFLYAMMVQKENHEENFKIDFGESNENRF